ncbi:citrate/2-methylcitrate synthase [Escherichia coli]
MFTFDPGLTSTASCESKITFIDGDEGILLHRGFPIDQLATDSNYLEVCYILLNGEKPTQEQYDEFKTTVTRHTMIHEQITRLFHAFRRDSHPMAVMCGITGALAAFYHDSLMLTILVIVKLPRSACCRKCRPWPRCVTSIPLVSHLFIRATISPMPVTS